MNAIFKDEKLSKQILNAAKKLSKKRPSDDSSTKSPTKRRKASAEEVIVPAALEESLHLPHATDDDENLSNVVLCTNRAPLVLAFAVTLLKYTMPSQPLSSRLSLAQAVVSVNSRSKAVSIGLEKGTSAEEEGWGQGQPVVRIMGRDIRVLKRWGYDPQEDAGTIKEESSQTTESPGLSPALWGLDLEALRSSKAQSQHVECLPIYSPQSARNYLLRSFAIRQPLEASPNVVKKKAIAAITAEKEKNLGLLLCSLDLLFESWAHVLSTEELDRRAWSWYVRVRPEVQDGVAGWGGKGEVKLSDILHLRRKG